MTSFGEVYGLEWNCAAMTNTGTFTRSTDCTISGIQSHLGGSGGINVSNKLEIVGTNTDMNNLITITAANTKRHFFLTNANAKLILRYLKLVGGDVSTYYSFGNFFNCGGSIFIFRSGGELNLYSSIVFNNKAGYGGGIYAHGTNPTNKNAILNIYSSIIQNNDGSDGGGIAMNYAIGTIYNTTIDNNQAGGGGGMYISYSDVTMTNTIISNNDATSGDRSSGGGGLLISGEDTNKKWGDKWTVILRQSSFINNHAKHYGDDIYTGYSPNISLINTYFNNPNNNNNIYEGYLYDGEYAPTWKTCSDKLCTEEPFTGTCNALKNNNKNVGVTCECVNSQKCIKCSTGTFQPIPGSIHNCKKCLSGKYQDEASYSMKCKSCASGTYTAKQGQTNCKTCKKGYSCADSTKNEQICQAGTYQDEIGSIECKSCTRGTYTTEQGQTSCETCKKGYSCTRTNEQICPQHTYQDETGSTSCKKCVAGKQGTGGDGKTSEVEACTKCDPGTSSKAGEYCKQCIGNQYSPDGSPCKSCSRNQISPKGSTRCYDVNNMLQNVRSLSEQQGGIIKSLALSNAKSNEVKEKANGLVAKLSLDWATQDVINEAQRLRNQLSTLPEYNVKHHCEQEKQRLAYGVLRTGVIVPSDAEIDDKYCLNENRDRLISSFCNFRPRFIKLLQEKLYPRLPSIPKYTGRDLWPNICCRKDNFQHLKTCNDPSGKVPRSHIVPFALAQGGNITVDNLYGEIVDVLKKDGYLQQGMNKAVNGIKDGDKLQQKVNNLFETTLLCGPREFGLPTNEGIRLCELFYPYEHMLTTYYNEVNALLEPLQRRRRRRMLGVWSGISNSFTNLMSSARMFMFGDSDEADNNDQVNVIRKLEDKMEMLEKKDAVSRKKIQHLEQKDAILEAKDTVSRHEIQDLKQKEAMSHSNIKTLKQQANKTNTFLSILKRNGVSKRRLGSTSDALCPFVTMSDVSEYEKDIDTFCTGYAHIDLNHPGTVINLAIMTPWDIPPKMIPELREKARYEITDDCPTPMFTPKDISLQNIDGTDLFVVQLDATSPNGYLRKELPQCGAANNIALRPHIPKTTIDVKIWRDHEDCCKDTKDYKVCKAIKCLPTDDPNGIEPVKDAWTGLQVGYHYKVIGTTYTATCDNKPNSKPCGSTRRRSLLQDEYGNTLRMDKYTHESRRYPCGLESTDESQQVGWSFLLRQYYYSVWLINNNN
eukprot:g3835.t1